VEFVIIAIALVVAAAMSLAAVILAFFAFVSGKSETLGILFAVICVVFAVVPWVALGFFAAHILSPSL